MNCICENCTKQFKLVGDSDEVKDKETSYIAIYSCESGGIYEIGIKCPHCGYKHELK